MPDLVQYQTDAGVCPFADWFENLEVSAALKVRTALARIEAGNFGDTKPVGGGVLERRIDWGPGYRLYFGREDRGVVVLLAGGTKKRQQADIERAKEYWAEYRRRRQER
jgi:putative addiction module killer protein